MVVHRDLVVDGTLDIECSDWDVFQLGATFDGHRQRVYYDGDELIDDLRMRGGTHYAHAGGVYDLLYVLERARVREIPCQVDRSQHRVTRIVMGGLTLRDSYSLWPAPLDELCGAIGEPVPRLPWRCICRCTCGRIDCDPKRPRDRGYCRRSCGGYCQISQRAGLGDPELEAYVRADARLLYLAMIYLRDRATGDGIAPRGTLGQTAWISAQDELGIPDSAIPYHLWRHARQGDKGGRIAVIRPYMSAGEVGAHHDICSAYPAALARAELPVGGCRELGGPGARTALESCLPGIYTVSVAVPEDSFIPPLPWSKAGMLAFPTGEFSGSWTLPELVAAFERGVELLAVHTAIVWEATAPIFAPLVRRWYDVRRAAGRKTPYGHWIGGLSKAITGKLAERPDRDRVSLYPDSIKVCTRGPQCRRECTRRCGAYEQLDVHGHIWAIPYHQMSRSAYPQWSAYLRALTRIQWLSQADRMGEIRSCSACGVELADRLSPCPDHPGAAVSLTGGGRAVCMGNTDSLWHTSRQTPEPLGDDVGQWELQHAFRDLEVRAPTIYAFRDPADPDDELQIRGIPGITEEDWRRGAGQIDRGIVTFGRAVKTTKGLFHARHRKWSLPSRDRVWFGDRKLHSDGLTYPATAEELRELARAIEARRRTKRMVDDIIGSASPSGDAAGRGSPTGA